MLPLTFMPLIFQFLSKHKYISVSWQRMATPKVKFFFGSRSASVVKVCGRPLCPLSSAKTVPFFAAIRTNFDEQAD